MNRRKTQKIYQYLNNLKDQVDDDNEIEFRLGKRYINKAGKTRFVPYQSRKKFLLIMDYLEQRYGEPELLKLFEYNISGIRLRKTNNGSIYESIRKKRIENTDIQLHKKTYIRLSLSRENKIKYNNRWKLKNPRRKQKYIFEDSNHKFELSETTWKSKTKKKVHSYQVEVEILIREISLGDKKVKDLVQRIYNSLLDIDKIINPRD